MKSLKYFRFLSYVNPIFVLLNIDLINSFFKQLYKRFTDAFNHLIFFNQHTKIKSTLALIFPKSEWCTSISITCNIYHFLAYIYYRIRHCFSDFYVRFESEWSDFTHRQSLENPCLILLIPMPNYLKYIDSFFLVDTHSVKLTPEIYIANSGTQPTMWHGCQFQYSKYLLATDNYIFKL